MTVAAIFAIYFCLCLIGMHAIDRMAKKTDEFYLLAIAAGGAAWGMMLLFFGDDAKILSRYWPISLALAYGAILLYDKIQFYFVAKERQGD